MYGAMQRNHRKITVFMLIFLASDSPAKWKKEHVHALFCLLLVIEMLEISLIILLDCVETTD